MSEEEKNEQDKLTDAKAHQASKDALGTAAKATGTYFGGPLGGKAVDLASKTAAGNQALDTAADITNKVMPKPAKQFLADNQEKISAASHIADNALGSTPQNINLDNSGYNPNLKNNIPNSVNNNSSKPLDASHISPEDITPREDNLDDLPDNLPKEKNKTNNIDDEASGEIKFPPVLFILLPLLVFIIFVVAIFMPLIHDYVDDDSHFNYEVLSLETCGRVRLYSNQEEYEDKKAKLVELKKELQSAETNNDTVEVNRIKEEIRTFWPSYTIDEYTAGVISHEINSLGTKEKQKKDSTVMYTTFAIAVRTYLFKHATKEESFCYIENSTNAQTFALTNNPDILEAVTNTHDYVLTENDYYVNTEYDAFYVDHKNDSFYYLKQKNQGIPTVWVEGKEKSEEEKGNVPEEYREIGKGGHGRGMSQYGAYYLVTEKDYGWKDLLSYYYGSNVEIKKVIIPEMNEDGEILSIGIGNADLPVGAGGFAWPAANMNNCSRGFGDDGHGGMDIMMVKGTPVYASRDGLVESVVTACPEGNGRKDQSSSVLGCGGSWGNNIFIKHSDGTTIYYTRYAHLSSVIVSQGQTVKQGDLIGYSGNTGNSIGSNGGYHLHFEIYQGCPDSKTCRVNPYRYLSGITDTKCWGNL